MRTALMGAALAVAILGGCTGLDADVQASAWRLDAAAGARSWRLATADAQTDDAQGTGYRALLDEALAQHGLVAAPQQGNARYRVTLAFAARPAAIGWHTADCPASEAGCAAPARHGFDWPGQKTYRHELTLRFFDTRDGREVYAVSAALLDHDPDPRHAAPLLVKSALARLPFDPAGAWRVGLEPGRSGEPGSAPTVTAVQPVQPAQR